MKILNSFLLIVIAANLVLSPVAQANEEIVSISDLASFEQASQELEISAEQEISLAQVDSEGDENQSEDEAQQAPPEKVVSPESVTHINVVGRALRNQAGDAIALACVDDSCGTIRAVLVDHKTNLAHFVGQVFTVTKAGEVATSKEIKVGIKNINLAYRIFKKEDPEQQKRKTKLLLGIVLGYGGVFFGSIFATAGKLGAGFGMGMTGAAIVLSLVVLIVNGTKPIFGNSGMITRVMSDQSGWNWLANPPHRVSEQTFALFNRFLMAK